MEQYLSEILQRKPKRSLTPHVKRLSLGRANPLAHQCTPGAMEIHWLPERPAGMAGQMDPRDTCSTWYCWWISKVYPIILGLTDLEWSKKSYSFKSIIRWYIYIHIHIYIYYMYYMHVCTYMYAHTIKVGTKWTSSKSSKGHRLHFQKHRLIVWQTRPARHLASSHSSTGGLIFQWRAIEM